MPHKTPTLEEITALKTCTSLIDFRNQLKTLTADGTEQVILNFEPLKEYNWLTKIKDLYKQSDEPDKQLLAHEIMGLLFMVIDETRNMQDFDDCCVKCDLRTDQVLDENILAFLNNPVLLQNAKDKGGLKQNIIPKLISKVLSLTTREEQLKYFSSIIKALANSCMFSFMQPLYTANPELFLEALVRASIAEELKSVVHAAIANNFPTDYDLLGQLNTEPGDLDFAGGKLVCAALAAVKADFRPIILKEFADGKPDELKEFFGLIRDNIATLEGQTITCVLTGWHWMDVVIQVKDQKANILLISSSTKAGDVKDYRDGTVDNIKKILGDNINKLVVARTHRQNATTGCSIFAINDLREAYRAIAAGEDIFQEKLPSRFLRSTQSARKLRSYLESKDPNLIRELRKPITKFGKSFENTALRHVKPVEVPNYGIGPLMVPTDRNTMIEHKTSRLKQRVIAYICRKNLSDIEGDTERVSLTGFKLWLAAVAATRGPPPPAKRQHT